MITEMKKYTFLVFHREYDEFLSLIREAGVLHIREKAEGMADNEQLQAAIVEADRLRHIIRQGAPDQLLHERDEVAQTLAATEKEQARMEIWGNFSQEKLAALAAEGYTLRYYACSSKSYQAEWGIAVGEKDGKTYFVQVNSDEEIPAEEIKLSDKNYSQLAADVDGLKGLLAAAEARIEAWRVAHLAETEAELHKAENHIDWQRVQLSTTNVAGDSLKLIEGFCPIDAEVVLKAKLDACDSVYYTVEAPTDEDPTPIKLRNNKFTQMFECLTGMYGWPSYGEWDPTPILGPFFLLFFALCMGDCGYGIVLTIVGILLAKDKLKIAMFDGLGPLIATLGVGTTVIGFFLGTFFGVDMYQLSWMPDTCKAVMLKGNVAGYDIQMVAAIVIGVFHLCLAMIVKAVCYTQRFGFKSQISSWGWLLLILGGIVTAVLAMVGLLSPEATKWTIIVIGAISALGIYIFNTPGRNPLINIGAGLWDTYNVVTGLLGDVLSYIRLYALGLAGGMLGAAFNNLGLMVRGDDPTWQWLPFVLILLLGHVLNLLMSALGAFVHPLRLSFVEYFKNSGYEGKGTMYHPFKK